MAKDEMGETGAPNGKAPTSVPEKKAPPSDKELLGLMEQEDAKKQEVMGQGAPEPTRPYRVRTMKYLRDVINKFSEVFPGAPAVEWEPEAGMNEWREPLPPDLWGPLNAVLGAIQAVNTNGQFEKYIQDPTTATSDEGLRAVAGTLDTALKDDALVAALKTGPGGEEAPETTEEVPEGEESSEPMEDNEEFEKYANRM